MRKMSTKTLLKITVGMCMTTVIVGSVIGCGSKKADNKNESQVETTVEETTVEETTEIVNEEPTTQVKFFDEVGVKKSFSYEEGCYIGVDYFDFDMDGKQEKVEMECKKDKEFGYCTYIVKINGKEIYKKENESISISTEDFDSNDSYIELVINTESNDDMQDFELFHITSDNVIQIKEDIDDNHLIYSTKNDGKVMIEYDVYNSELGCFFIEDTLVLKNQKIDSTITDNIYKLNKYSRKNVYKLAENIDVYPDFKFQGKPIQLKKEDQIKVKRIYIGDFTDPDAEWNHPVIAAQVVHNDEVIGWINIKDNKEIFDEATIPAWD